MMDPEKLQPENFEQLALDLNIDESEAGDGILTPEEATRRSEVALIELKKRLQHDDEILTSSKRLDLPKDLLTWSEDFYFLLECGWPWRVAVLIIWLSIPRAERVPKTQDELARTILGLTSDRQLSKWRHDNKALDEAVALLMAKPLMDYKRRIFEALAISASDPSHHGAQDRKTALTILDVYEPHSKVDIHREKIDPNELSEEELREIAKKAKPHGD